MKIGYPCLNGTIGCKGNKTFRLKSYSEERLIDTINHNIQCLKKIMQFNIEHNLLFFRITSDLIPFASHPICTFNWQSCFKNDFEAIGKIIKKFKIRISMHPDQFIILNSKDDGVVNRSIAELYYHAEVLDLMKLDRTAKIQLHIGGAYEDKIESMKRFAKIYKGLDEKIKKRLVIENDDKIYSFKDCLFVHEKTNIPIVFDVFHHVILNHNESVNICLESQKNTWKVRDGIPLIDYSSQKPDARRGSHAESIDIIDFKTFLDESQPFNFDIMLEIKDKESSALKALTILKNDFRFYDV